MIFPPEVVSRIAAHMNGDHADDNVLICRSFGREPGVTAARMSGMDADGMDFVAVVDGVDVPIRVPFSEHLTERRQVRAEAVRMYREACADLGLTPRH
jgi:putative heme iron utilization protein